MPIELMMPSNHPILCYPLFLLSSTFPSIRIFSSELALCIRWPKYGSLSIRTSSEYSRLISFSTHWFGLCAVQGTLKGLLQHDNLKASVLQCSAFIMAQLSHQSKTTEKTLALTIRTLVSKVITLLFNTLSMFVIVFLPRSKRL